MELTKDIVERIYSLVESVKLDGKLRKGVNEVTKSLERAEAKLVVVASDVNPKDVIMHFPLLAKEKGIMYLEVPSKTELGAAAGLPVPTAAVAVANPGESKKKLDTLITDIKALMKGEGKAKEEKVEEKRVEEKAPVENKAKKAPETEEKTTKKETPDEKPKSAPETEEKSKPVPSEKPAKEEKSADKSEKSDSKSEEK
jgi:large subunit ribosomal protein L7Ae|tara:strand:- start:962 stop:1558 length:597 start_codon:yes stop_codon:yes gene_type:complete